MLQELMDDEDEMRDMNLSSRPGREEKRRVRERDRLEREMERSELSATTRTACGFCDHALPIWQACHTVCTQRCITVVQCSIQSSIQQAAWHMHGLHSTYLSS